jgi:hypothetical protein
MNKFFLAAALIALPVVADAPAHALLFSGFNTSSLAANDDGSTGLIPLGFTTNINGTNYTQAYVNNNGNITFNAPLSTFTPFSLTNPTTNPILAPFFADIDTRGTGSGLATYGQGTVGGRSAFGATWVDVGYFSFRVDKLNTLQVVLVNRDDLGIGSSDIYFNYDKIQFETGEASGGVNGLGGTVARVGFNAGASNRFELPGSGVSGAFLDGGSNALISSSNYGVTGSYLFTIRQGQIAIDPGPIVPGPINQVPFEFNPVLGVLGLGTLFGAKKMSKSFAKKAV